MTAKMKVVAGATALFCTITSLPLLLIGSSQILRFGHGHLIGPAQIASLMAAYWITTLVTQALEGRK